jgi:hypothetical protein
VEAREALKISPGCSRKALANSAKALVTEEVNSSRLDNLQSLERQGQLSRPSCAPIWSRAVLALPEDQLKFAINAAVDVLPHNANLYLWKKRKDPACPLCHENQSLLHVLNNCSVARDSRRYNTRHDSVLSAISKTVRRNIPLTASVTADISTSYEFPHHIIPTDLRPDLVWWDEARKSITLVDLTVCFETNFGEAARRKTAKYLHLVDQAKARGYRSELITLQVGSRGVPDLPGFENFAESLSLPHKDLVRLLESTARLALAGSFGIWCARNKS